MNYKLPALEIRANANTYHKERHALEGTRLTSHVNLANDPNTLAHAHSKRENERPN